MADRSINITIAVNLGGLPGEVRRSARALSRFNQIVRAKTSQPSKLAINGAELSRRRRSR